MSVKRTVQITVLALALTATGVNAASAASRDTDRADRDQVRAIHAESGLPYFEIYVECPLEEAEKRDPKGLYKKARAGEIKGFTGIDDPYDEPESAELVLHTADQTIEESAEALLKMLEMNGIL